MDVGPVRPWADGPGWGVGEPSVEGRDEERECHFDAGHGHEAEVAGSGEAGGGLRVGEVPREGHASAEEVV